MRYAGKMENEDRNEGLADGEPAPLVEQLALGLYPAGDRDSPEDRRRRERPGSHLGVALLTFAWHPDPGRSPATEGWRSRGASRRMAWRYEEEADLARALRREAQERLAELARGLLASLGGRGFLVRQGFRDIEEDIPERLKGGSDRGPAGFFLACGVGAPGLAGLEGAELERQGALRMFRLRSAAEDFARERGMLGFGARLYGSGGRLMEMDWMEREAGDEEEVERAASRFWAERESRILGGGLRGGGGAAARRSRGI